MAQKANTDIGIMILAGGGARRFGGIDKCLLEIGGISILSHILFCLGGDEVHYPIVINANDRVDLGLAESRFGSFGFPIFGDVSGVGVDSGPLAGILSGLEYFVNFDRVFIIAGDYPFLPYDLLERLLYCFDLGYDIVFAGSGGRRHPVVSLWSVSLAGILRESLVSGVRKIEDFTSNYSVGVVDFEIGVIDPFFNVNCAEDLAEAERVFRGKQ